MSEEMLSFRRAACWHFPLFQFCRETMKRRAEVSRIIEELRIRRDGIELAEWFIRPNPRLGARLPVNLLEQASDAVLRAAQVDRLAEQSCDSTESHLR